MVPSQSAACVHCLLSWGEFIQVCSWAAAKQINFSCNWLLGRWKAIKLFSLNVSWQSYCFCCVARETASIMAHSRTVSHMLAWINAAQILEKWILSGKMQPLPIQQIDAEGTLNSVYTWLVWSCSCKVMKYHPIVHERFDSSTASGWNFPALFFSMSWVWCFQPHCNSVVPPGVGNGNCRAGIGSGWPISSSQVWSWPKESRCGLQGNLSCLVANVSVSKPVPEQILFQSPLQKNFSYFFF